ncbi:dihydroxyacetone kinase subunit DhaK [Tuanshanicoccus lijuaniae]|uniref:dihydroxyacetone kinase subunit DhaK n=1 Tax=Aerococcaceae bacterium zg-1292 TaxID=2774330 RepID=UPI001BD8CD17|nr:dihydroxyacetone kinase subunit DhaK [Aerococcaceae bacterium zg-BR22]MBS4455508.1 dihydroxyacetone kinase subunit DhaK [Aerococcaceae bacterium zg-A91]MBS4457127.1 dihydroxyacetone kinase subunit DhaK [Aerococcaceae bacterium zg-BR33]
MKKIMNNPENIVEEMLNGFAIANNNIINLEKKQRIIYRKNKSEKKVGLISGGGTGHEPSHAGFVGKGMLDAAVCGSVFTSPGPEQILEAIRLADNGMGVLMIVKNYSGDIMNFEIAQELAILEGIEVESVIVCDDIAVEDSLYTQGRRGVAGTILVHKILGYFAENGLNLSELKTIADSVVNKIKTVGIALSGVTTPEGGKESFILSESTIEFGVGIHGEPGYSTNKLEPSKVLAKELINKILVHIDSSSKYVGVLVNGLGGTPLMEQYVFYSDVEKILSEKGYEIVFSKIGNYMTALDMEGISLTIMDLENKDYLDALVSKVSTVAW